MRVLNKTPKCPKFEKRDGPEGSVNAPYLGYRKREEDADRKHREIRITQWIIAGVMFLTVLTGIWGLTIQDNTQEIVKEGVQIQRDTQEIVKETQNITAESSIPNKPRLTVSLKTNPVLSRKQFVDADKYTDYRAWVLEVCLSNDGRRSTGPIRLSWNSEWTYPFLKDLESIDGIGGTNCSLLDVNCKECSHQYLNTGIVNESLMPPGPLKLELKVECKYCDPRVFIETFDICVYEKHPDECPVY